MPLRPSRHLRLSYPSLPCPRLLALSAVQSPMVPCALTIAGLSSRLRGDIS